MADGSPEDRAGSLQANHLTFSAPHKTLCDTNECSDETIERDSVKLSFYRELDAKESCEKSETRGVAATSSVVVADSRKHSYADAADGDDRKRRCIDRYDSSESSDSGVVVLSPTESSACSGSSDIASPRSPRSPESSCSGGGSEEGGAGARMPPWASEPAPPPAARRIPTVPAPIRRPSQLHHRRITEYFNHKMKPQNGLKRDHAQNANHDDAKKKCLLKSGVTHEIERYITYISKTLSPKVLMDVGTQADTGPRKLTNAIRNHSLAKTTATTHSKTSSAPNGALDLGRSKKDSKGVVHTTMNGFMEIRQGTDNHPKEKQANGHLNGFVDNRKEKQVNGHLNGIMDGRMHGIEMKTLDPSANGIHKHIPGAPKGKVPIPALPSANAHRSPIKLAAKPDNCRMNGVVSSTTKLDSRMNGVMCGSNNLSLNSNSHKPMKRELPKKSSDGQPSKRTNRKSSACIANSKNLTWSKANNLKQVQLQKQNCVNNVAQNTTTNNVTAEANTAPKINMPNGVRQVSMTVNGSIGNLNVPANNFQNCHQINIPQPCNGTVTSNNLTSFVAVPQNVMLTTLRIPQNGIPAQTLNHQNNINNMTSFNRNNVNVSSPTKLNGQFVFPLMQNINGTVVQIPNLMAKMPNFVLPQNSQIAQRQDHQLPNQQPQILFNGTLLKLANTMSGAYQNVNKGTMTSQPLPMNKNVTGVPTVGMPVQPKPNFSFSHPVLMPQTGFIVTSVPNMTVKETWSYTGSTASTPRSSCSNPIVNHPPPLLSFTNQTLHTSSIPIAPVKPPDNPIQGTEPPSSTVKEHDTNEAIPSKCDIPWLSKTVNNNIVQLETSNISTRPFSHVSSTLSDKLENLATVEKIIHEKKTLEDEETKVEEENKRVESTSEELRKVEEVARREETIFTQITVLKDVTSNVHSTMIEASFRGDSTESESGIGTDKSIDSPSDSQTSKECDDDSSLSLSVSICSVETQSQKSPILKQPKTLRFPPRNLTKKENDGRRKSSIDNTSTVVICLWENCKKEFEGDPDLLEHLQSEHVETQVGRENYVCLWEQCKVRGKPSCSRLWLERHTLSHGGSKPFRCIVDGCERRFSSQTLLERHVNNHFNEVSPSGGSGKKTNDSSTRLIRRNGKKLRYRRQPWSARMFDFFDSGMMEGLAWRLYRATRWRLGGGCPLREPPATAHTLTLRAALAASRYNAHTGAREHLLCYYPPHVIEDEWVAEKDVKLTKRVEIASLPAHTKVTLYEQFCDSYTLEPSPLPQKTKPAAKNCTSSRLLNNLIAKQRKSVEIKAECSSNNLPQYLEEKSERVEVSGAKKRKMGRRYGGNSFWPCGR